MVVDTSYLRTLIRLPRSEYLKLATDSPFYQLLFFILDGWKGDDKSDATVKDVRRVVEDAPSACPDAPSHLRLIFVF